MSGLSASGQVVQQTWANASNQRWYVTYERPQSVRLVNAATGQTLAVTSGAAGAPDQVLQQTYDGTSGQQFAIRPATPPQLQVPSSLGAGTAPFGGSVTVPLAISNPGNLPSRSARSRPAGRTARPRRPPRSRPGAS